MNIRDKEVWLRKHGNLSIRYQDNQSNMMRVTWANDRLHYKEIDCNSGDHGINKMFNRVKDDCWHQFHNRWLLSGKA